MKALIHTDFGPPDVLRLADVEKPSPKPREVLVQVRAAAVNPLDWHLLRAEPNVLKLMGRPEASGRIPGVDVAGEVEAVGAKVIAFHPGDQVFGTCKGAFAEYVCGKETRFAAKPVGLTHAQAAAIPVAGCTALQALRDHGRLQRGQHVLVNGAAGGVGTFAVQIAKALGAHVTGVCSTRNVDLVRSIGADHVVDYTAEDFTQHEGRYDLIVKVAGTRSVAAMRKALAPRGTLVVVGGGVGRATDDGTGLLELLNLMVGGRVLSPFVRQRCVMFIAQSRQSDLVLLSGLTEAGHVTPVIDRTYALADVPEAIRYLEAGHARGKVVIAVE